MGTVKFAMDVVAAVSGYIAKMVALGDSSTTGSSSTKMKILLLDSETVGDTLWLLLWPLLTSRLGSHRLDRHDPVRPPQP